MSYTPSDTELSAFADAFDWDGWTAPALAKRAFARAVLAKWGAVQQEAQEPMFWVRLCSDGLYEGPIHNARIEEVRKKSGAWSPLYLTAPQPAPAPLSDAIEHYLESQDALDNREYAGINAESYEKLIRRRNASREDLDAALAAQKGTK